MRDDSPNVSEESEKKIQQRQKKKEVLGATSKLLVLETTGISDVFFVSSSTSRIVAELRG